MANYYVDSDVAGPGDGSFGDPWDDIASNVNSLSAGDTLHLRGNAGSYQLYTEPEILITVDGTAANPITIRPYQSEKVEIRKSTYGEIFDIDGDYVVVDGIATDQSQLYINKNNSAGYAIRCDGANITLQNFEVANISGAGSDSLIYFSSASSYGTVDNCKIHDAFKTNTTDAHGVTINGSNYTTVTNCTVYDCAGDCLYVHNTTCYGWSLTDNTLYTTLGAGSENGIDAKMNTVTARATISGNTIYGFYACTGLIGGSGDGDGEAISIHNSADYVDCYDNTIYDCTSGITCEDGATSIVVRNNLIYDLHTTVQDTNASTSNMGALHFVSVNGVDCWNNTIHNAPVNSIILLTSVSDLVLQNNIFNDCGTIHDPSALSGSVTYSYNCWFNCTDTWSGTGDVTSDPLFNNEAGDDYTLDSSSPCIDAGIDVGLDYNASAPDMGAFEFEQTVIVNPVASAVVRTVDPTVDISSPGGPHVITPTPASAVVLTVLTVAVTFEPVVVLDGGVMVLDGAVVVVG